MEDLAPIPEPKALHVVSDAAVQTILSRWPVRRWIATFAMLWTILGAVVAGGWWLGVQVVSITLAFSAMTNTMAQHTEQLADLKNAQAASVAALVKVAKTLSEEASAISKLQGYNDGQQRGPAYQPSDPGGRRGEIAEPTAGADTHG